MLKIKKGWGERKNTLELSKHMVLKINGGLIVEMIKQGMLNIFSYPQSLIRGLWTIMHNKYDVLKDICV